MACFNLLSEKACGRKPARSRTKKKKRIHIVPIPVSLALVVAKSTNSIVATRLRKSDVDFAEIKTEKRGAGVVRGGIGAMTTGELSEADLTGVTITTVTRGTLNAPLLLRGNGVCRRISSYDAALLLR